MLRSVVLPLRRSDRARAYHAGAAAVGLAIAFTPTVGLQVPLVTGVWMIARFAFRRRFNFVLACAVTWTTNAVTVLPAYTLFYWTGARLLGQTGDDGAIATLSARLGDLSWHPADWVAVLWPLMRDSGLALTVGCVPYALAAGAIGYVATDRLLARLRRPRDTRSLRAALPAKGDAA